MNLLVNMFEIFTRRQNFEWDQIQRIVYADKKYILYNNITMNYGP